jgi:hypothetical protein
VNASGRRFADRAVLPAGRSAQSVASEPEMTAMPALGRSQFGHEVVAWMVPDAPRLRTRDAGPGLTRVRRTLATRR